MTLSAMETERLMLRPWAETDAADLFEFARDPRVGPMAGWPPHADVEESRRLIQTVLSEPETYAVVLKSAGRAVGSIGLKIGAKSDMTAGESEAELGYWIGVPYWGQGLIPEAVRAVVRRAFEQLALETLWCGYYDGNVQSRRVQEKCGFVYHHTTEGLYLPLMNETRTGHVSCLTRASFRCLLGETRNSRH